MVFEDALHALRTAKAAGFRTAAVYDESEPEQEELRRLAGFWKKRLPSRMEPSCNKRPQ